MKKKHVCHGKNNYIAGKTLMCSLIKAVNNSVFDDDYTVLVYINQQTLDIFKIRKKIKDYKIKFCC